ncbi:MAG: flippase [Candidatus Pacearchaeota archaeon]
MNFFKKNLKRGKNLAKNEEDDIKDIWRRIKTRDFSGNTGMAVKNSVYQFSKNLTAKIGSFIFTIIIARLLMPELFGYYSLALSTILIFGTFAELGVQTTLVRFVSKEFSKRKKKIGPYLKYLGKLKFALMFFTALVLLISAKYIANTFYQKPIFLALLAGALYLIMNELSGFLKSMLHASNNFKSVFKREFVFQISRIILVPLAILFAIKNSLESEFSLMLIILFLSVALFLASAMMFFDVRKTYSKELKSKKQKNLSKKQKTKVNKFLTATAVLTLSGIFFGNIDKVMLGVFVPGEFIGFYTAGFSLVGALVGIVGFASVALLPIFSRLKGKRLQKGLKKSVRLTLLASSLVFIATILLAYLAILIVYGNEYINSVGILRALAPLIFILPIVAIYQSYHLSQGRPNLVAKVLIISTILNVVLNYVLITSLLTYGNLAAVYGAVIATLVSKGVYLGGLVFARKRIK